MEKKDYEPTSPSSSSRRRYRSPSPQRQYRSPYSPFYTYATFMNYPAVMDTIQSRMEHSLLYLVQEHGVDIHARKEDALCQAANNVRNQQGYELAARWATQNGYLDIAAYINEQME